MIDSRALPLDPVPNPPTGPGAAEAIAFVRANLETRFVLTLREVGEYADALRPLFAARRL